MLNLMSLGDTARYLPDGAIQFAGRADDQVKIRGYRVELGEVEATISNHPSICKAAVMLREDIPGMKQLVAYIVTQRREEQQLMNITQLKEELVKFCKRYLPDYMIPRVYVQLDALPLTPSGKLNRKSLPIPQQQQLEEDTTRDHQVDLTVCSFIFTCMGLHQKTSTVLFF